MLDNFFGRVPKARSSVVIYTNFNVYFCFAIIKRVCFSKVAYKLKYPNPYTEWIYMPKLSIISSDEYFGLK